MSCDCSKNFVCSFHLEVRLAATTTLVDSLSLQLKAAMKSGIETIEELELREEYRVRDSLN